jgi:hypothetical protein
VRSSRLCVRTRRGDQSKCDETKDCSSGFDVVVHWLIWFSFHFGLAHFEMGVTQSIQRLFRSSQFKGFPGLVQ